MFRIPLLAASAAALSFMAFGASAADLPAYEPAPAVAVPSFTWTGPYIGVQAGYAFGDSNWPGLKPKGFVIGGYAGYNFQFDASPVVVGIETDFNYADIDDNTSSFGIKERSRWTGATRARVGYAFNRFLVYGAGGVAYARRKISVGGLGSDSKNAVGWTVGGGLEYAATDRVAVRVEYRYTDFGSDSFSPGGVRDRASYDEHRVMAGVSYKFSGW
jgi:outer membrane immunogenic protein